MDFDEVVAHGYELELEDRFDGGALDRGSWLPFYLPQWSSRDRSAARYDLSEGRLRLMIEQGQPPWCPELDGPTRVSSLQTGVYSGPVGGSVGQHRFHPDAIVREAQSEARLLTPRRGAFSIRAAATDDPRCMSALWMIGFEDRPERSAEICVFEIFGRDVESDAAAIGMGVHPFGDPTIVDDFERLRLPIDVRRIHEYAAVWTHDDVSFYVDGRRVRVVDESPGYEMQFMLGIYEFGDRTPLDRFPKVLTVERFRIYRPTDD